MKEVIMQVQSFSVDCPKAPIYVGDLVRCKDCKYRDPEDERCDHGAVNFLLRRMDNDFCSYGERKGGDTE